MCLRSAQHLRDKQTNTALGAVTDFSLIEQEEPTIQSEFKAISTRLEHFGRDSDFKFYLCARC